MKRGRIILKKIMEKMFVFCIIVILMASSIPLDFINAGKVKAENYTGTDVVNYAMQFKGCGYVLGNSGPNTFDCVGLVKYVYAHFGVSLPMGTSSYNGDRCLTYGTKITDKFQMQPGDIVFYGNSSNDLGHAAIYIGGGQIIHALNPTYGVLVNTVDMEMCKYFGFYYNGAPLEASYYSTYPFQFGLRIIGGSSPIPTPTYTSSFPLKNNATYKITSALSGKVMEVSTGSSQNSKQINLWTYDNSAWMQWKAVQHSDGYSFINVHTGKALDIADGSLAESAKVTQYDYNASDAQRFKLIDKGNGRYGMIAVCSNLAVDVYGSDKTDGAKLEQYSFHGGDNQLWIFEPISDVEPPVVTSIVISDVDNTGYTVTAKATDNIGVTSIDFLTKRLNQGTDKWQWHQGTRQADGSYSYRVKVSDFDSVDYTYQTHVYAYDAAGNSTFGGEVRQYVDTTPPVISDIQISDMDANGYTVSCTVTDNNGVDRVQFPTWTDYKGQDDLDSNWTTSESVRGTRSGNRFSFKVKNRDHNYEGGDYITHIYAYDAAGNYSSYTGVMLTLKKDSEAVKEISYNGHIYQLFDDKLTWTEAKQACEDKGGHLVTITAKEEQETVQGLLPAVTTSNGYFIGGYTEHGQSKWVTDEPFSYSHWISGQPDGWNGTEAETAYVMCTDAYGGACAGWWNDIVGTQPGYGYICEFETVKVTGIDLSENNISLNKGDRKEISAIVSSESGYPALVNWSSENEDVAVVVNNH